MNGDRLKESLQLAVCSRQQNRERKFAVDSWQSSAKSEKRVFSPQQAVSVPCFYRKLLTANFPIESRLIDEYL